MSGQNHFLAKKGKGKLFREFESRPFRQTLEECMSKLIFETIIIDGIEYEQTKTTLTKGEGSRGLGLITFVDKYHQECSLQDSSIATEPCIWLGVDSTGPSIPGPSGMVNEQVGARMHLTKAMVQQLLPFLKKFAEEEEYIANMKVES